MTCGSASPAHRPSCRSCRSVADQPCPPPDKRPRITSSRGSQPFPGRSPNEAWCMGLAARVGLDVAAAEARAADTHPYLIVTRYDRAQDVNRTVASASGRCLSSAGRRGRAEMCRRARTGIPRPVRTDAGVFLCLGDPELRDRRCRYARQEPLAPARCARNAAGASVRSARNERLAAAVSAGRDAGRDHPPFLRRRGSALARAIVSVC